jgi:N,N'-diacetyllegionaminate synthase
MPVILPRKSAMSKVIIIAEAGVNHNGDVNLAKQLVDVAAAAGADYVKFQTFKAENIASKKAGKADYQKETTSANETQVQMLKKLELSYDDHLMLLDYCQQRSVAFLSTPFDIESIQLLKNLGIRIGKIPSGDITNLPYLQKMAESFEELILSTGMADMNEIEEAIRAITSKGFPKEKLIVLHCNTEYPTPYSDVNLKAMQTISGRFSVKVGYSDHTQGIEVPIGAVALGACLIEKHFTLSRKMEGPDHKASLEPSELKEMITSIRNIEAAVEGDGQKLPSRSEIKNKEIARKSIVAACPIRKGEILSDRNLAVKRPGTGLSPMLWYQVCGTSAKRNFDTDELIQL